MDAAIFGLIVADLIAAPMNLREPPPPGGLHLLDSLSLTTGGNVCNTGVAMARLGMSVAAAGLVDLYFLMARTSGIETPQQLERLLPAKPFWLRIARAVRPVF
jgi:hypothetical protein